MEFINEDDKENQPLISVVVPVLNADMFLSEMIESVLCQTYKSWELLLVDAESEDGSISICEEYAKKYSNIFLFKIERKSPGNSRNFGMRHAKGAYICFFDADDYLSDSNLFENYIKIAVQGKKDIVVCDYERLWKGKLLPATSHSAFSKYGMDTEEFRFRGFFSVGSLSYVWNKLYSIAFLKAHEISFTDESYAEDKLFNIQCYLNGATYAFLPEKGYVYRKNEQSVSHKYDSDRSKGWVRIAQRIEAIQTTNLTDYTIFFAAFFDVKMEYENNKKSLRSAKRVLQNYGKDPLAEKCFKHLWKEKRKNLPESFLWRGMMRGFSFFMSAKCYLFLAIGIKLLIDLRIDERLSDTGKRD